MAELSGMGDPLNLRFGHLNRVLATERGTFFGQFHVTEAPITGPFGRLPPELLDAIALHLVKVHATKGDALDKEARVASQSLAAFVQLAKGFGAVTALPRAEAISLGRCVTPNFCEAVPLPFLNQILKEVESQLSMRALLRSLRNVLLHCADEHCAGARRHHNRVWEECHLNQFAPLVSRVVGTRKLHLAVGWKRDGALLCSSDAGAIVSTPKRVMAIESAPTAVLSPDTELRVAWSIPASSEVFMATSRGALVVTATAIKDTADEDTYRLETWDMARNVCVDRRTEHGRLRALWLLPDQTLVRLVSEAGLLVSDGLVSRSSHGTGPVTQHILASNGVFIAWAYCANTGEVALMRSDMRMGMPAPAVPWFQDVITVNVVHWKPLLPTPVRGEFETSTPSRDTVSLSPTGDLLVVCGRGHVEPRFLFYRMQQAHEWVLNAQVSITEAYCCSIPQVVDGHVSTEWSPCGSLFLVLVHTVHTGLLVFNVRDTIRSGAAKSRFWRASGTGMPLRLAWRNGLWAQTRSGLGVMRLGLLDV